MDNSLFFRNGFPRQAVEKYARGIWDLRGRDLPRNYHMQLFNCLLVHHLCHRVRPPLLMASASLKRYPRNEARRVNKPPS